MAFIDLGYREQTSRSGGFFPDSGRYMALYTFYIIKSTSPVASIDVAVLNDDDAAREHAGCLCEAHNTCVRIEIWQGNRLVVDEACASHGPLEDKQDGPPQTSSRSPEDILDGSFVKAKCPVSGQIVQTHARLTTLEIRTLKTGIVYWCRACGCAHEASRDDLIAPDA